MQEPVPQGLKVPQNKEVVEKPVITDQVHHQFEKNIAGHLNQAGYKVTEKDISTNHSSVFEGIEDAGGEILDDTRDYAGTTIAELTGGATYIREAEGKRGSHIWHDRVRKLAQKMGLKKAA